MSKHKLNISLSNGASIVALVHTKDEADAFEKKYKSYHKQEPASTTDMVTYEDHVHCFMGSDGMKTLIDMRDIKLLQISEIKEEEVKGE